MIRRQLNRVKFVLTIVVYAVPLFSFCIAAYIRFGNGLVHFSTSEAEPYPYFGLLLLTTVIWAVASEHYGLTSVELLFASGGKLRRVLLTACTTCVVVLATAFFYRDVTFSRVFIWISASGLILMSLILQTMLRGIWSNSARRHDGLINVLIVGADEFALRVSDDLLSGQLMPCRVAGYVRLPGQHTVVDGEKVYELEEVPQLALGHNIDDVVVALPPDRMGQLPTFTNKLECLCVPLRVVLELGEGISIRQRIFNLGGLVMLDLQSTPAESMVYLSLKRLFDLAFSLCVLTITAPLFVLIYLAVKITSRGPAFFVQERVGLNGKIFAMIKFRTMGLAPKGESDTRWTVPNDPRCTRIGKLLRRTGLDEIPQFLNVIKGDMSVVGPRPERPLLVEKFMHSIGNYNARHYLKVGITGWAQVNGWRGDTSIEKRVEYDLYYLRHWTLSFDFLIVILTLFRGFTDKNAY